MHLRARSVSRAVRLLGLAALVAATAGSFASSAAPGERVARLEAAPLERGRCEPDDEVVAPEAVAVPARRDLQLRLAVRERSGEGQLVDVSMSDGALSWLAMMLLLSLDLHHWMIVGFQRSYAVVPMGAPHLSEALLLDVPRTPR